MRRKLEEGCDVMEVYNSDWERHSDYKNVKYSLEAKQTKKKCSS